MKNIYLHHAHVSESKFRAIVHCFCDDFDATQTRIVTGVSRVIVNHLFALFRTRILSCTGQRKKVNGSVEIDESYFGARRIRGKRGRGAGARFPS